MLFGLLTLVTGVAYPLVVTGIAKVAFAGQAAGSLVLRDGKVDRLDPDRPDLHRPEKLLGPPVGHQSPMSTNGGSSSGSNQGPTNPALVGCRQGAHRRAPRRAA